VSDMAKHGDDFGSWGNELGVNLKRVIVILGLSS